MAGRIVVGTSSWTDPGFVRDWYPRGLPARDRLPYYAERFEGVEVNATWYAVPDAPTVERWADVTPDGFTFDVKLHRLLSRHAADLKSLPKDLRDLATTTERGRVRLDDRLEDALVDRTLEVVRPLIDAGKLSSFLLQLSPAFTPRDHELDELTRLLERLAPQPVAVELRRRGWVRRERAERTLSWLEEHGAAWVCTDMPPATGRHPTILPPVDAVTLPRLAYLRAHGRDLEGYTRGRSIAERFGYHYSDRELGEIRERVEHLAERAGQVRVMFNNNRSNEPMQGASTLRRLLNQAVKPKSAP